MPDDKDYNESPGEINKLVGSPPTDVVATQASKDKQILEEVASNTKVIKALSQDLLVISVDKIRLAYAEHISTRSTKNLWIAPIGLFCTLLLSLLTTTFADSFGVTGATWKAFFMFGCLLTLIWSIIAIKKSIQAPQIDDVDAFINSITVGKTDG